MACSRCSAPRSGRSSRFRCMRIARSVSPRRRNRLPRAKCSSTVSGSTLTTSMKASIALSGCSFSRKLRPLKYERGSCRDSHSSCLMSTRAASQPSPKNSANPNSHQSSKSMESPDLGLRRQAAAAGRAQLALELVDIAALPEQARQAGENPDPGAEGEEEEQDHDHRGLPGLPQEEAQRHPIGIQEREGEYGEEQQRAQQPRQMGDELHLTDCRKGGTPPLYPQNPSLQKNASLSGSVFSSLPTTRSKANGGTSSMPPSACLRPRLLFLIDPLAQFLAGFEMRNEFLGYVDPLARFRIAADARRPMIQPETPEPADLDALPLDQALRHRIQDHLDREFGILGDELRITRREPRNKFGLGHAGPRLLLSVLVVQFRLEERAQVGASGAGGAFALELGHRFVLLGKFLLLDRKIDGSVLAVDVDDHRRDAVAFLEVGPGVLDAVAGDLGGAQVALEVAAHGDDRPLGVDRLDGPRDELAFFVARDEVVERIAFELLDAERDALALDVDREHQAVDPALEPDENAEVGDRLDRAADLVPLLEVHSELFPGIGKALLHPEGDAAPLLVDLEDHDLHLVAEGDHFRRMHVLVRPVHLRHVHQALDTLLHR